jgi:hypothetical protein
MHGGASVKQWGQMFGVVLLCGLLMAFTGVIFFPGARVNTSNSTARLPTSPRSFAPPGGTPEGDTAVVSLTPSSGPVGTLISIQGTGWPASTQLVLKYGQDPTCVTAQEVSPDPTPTTDSAGSFAATISWPSVPQTGGWLLCAVTSDGIFVASDSFQVLALNPPSVTIAHTGTIIPGQQLSVQGENWLPGGLLITFALLPAHSTLSTPLNNTAISLLGGAFSGAVTLPMTLSAGKYTLLASAEQQALQAQTASFSVTPTPTATPSPTPSPEPPTPVITPSPTPPPIKKQTPPASPPKLTGLSLGLVIISGGMALSFALIGAALLIYLHKTRPRLSPEGAESGQEETR